ncbi:MAG: hypothetical protein GX813_03920, partial [Erysipelotrichia bacterium]|nr:hypothetical protein [Erysipelotrichia bacterium]
INGNGKLRLKNLILDGGRSSSDNYDGALIYIKSGELYIGENTTLKRGKRLHADGGGAIVVESSSKLVMTGGLITQNYATDKASAIGFFTPTTQCTVRLLGGKIINNGTTTAFAIANHQNVDYYFGGDFEMHGNTIPSGEYNMNITSGTANRRNIHIYEDFSGKIYFSDARSNLPSRTIDSIEIINANGNPISGSPKHMTNVSPVANKYLYLKYSGSAYSWTYAYEDNHALITPPTVNATGKLARRAIIGGTIEEPVYSNTIVIEEVVLPKLNAVDYDSVSYDSTTDKITYVYIHNGVTYPLIYDAPASNNAGYSQVEITSPTITTEGLIEKRHSSYPGVAFETFITPILSDEGYDLVIDYNSKTETYTLKNEYGAPIGVTVVIDFPLDITNYHEPSLLVIPTVNATGSASVSHSSLPGALLEIDLPKLAVGANLYTFEGVTNGEAFYTYVDQITGVEIVVSYVLADFNAFTQSVLISPTKDNPGNAKLTHPDLPGLEVDFVLPLLNSDSYVISEDGGSILYAYTETNTGEVITISVLKPADGFVYDLTESPAAEQPGTITITHPDLPGWNEVINVASLNGSDYTISIVNGEAIYNYTEPISGLDIEVKVALPTTNYTQTVSKPTLSNSGSATVTHPDLPGVLINVILPVLSDPVYIISRDDETVFYTYIEPLTGEELVISVVKPNSNYIYTDTKQPGVGLSGEIIATHPNLPNWSETLSVPPLNGSDYAITIADNEIIYTYTEPTSEKEIEVRLPYNYATGQFTWTVNENATLTDGGILFGTNPDYPGVTFTIEIPSLDNESYDVSVNEDGTLRYTLKDKLYGDIYFDVPALEGKVNLWPLIIIQLIIILILGVFIALKLRENAKRKDEVTAMITLPFFVIIIPHLAWLWISLLAIILIAEALYLGYLFLKDKKDEGLSKTKETNKSKAAKKDKSN